MRPNYGVRYAPKSRVVYRLDDSDFDTLVQQVYGREFAFAADRESSNDSSHEFNDIRKQENYESEAFRLSEYDRRKLTEFVTTGVGTYVARLLLQDLVDHEVLPEGNYLIRVSW